MTLNLLEGNLTAIYRALKAEDQDLHFCLKASNNSIKFCKRPSKNALNIQKKPFLDHSSSSSRLAKAIAHTHYLFHQNLNLVEKDYHQYKNYLLQCGKGYLIEEQTVFDARRNITAWNQKTRSFVKLMQTEKNVKFVKLLEKIFLKNIDASIPSRINHVFTPPLSIEIAEMQKVIDLEGVTAGPLPLALFKKIIKEKPLSSSDNKDLCKWIKKINTSQISLKHFHETLSYLVSLYGHEKELALRTLNRDRALDVYRLELALQNLSLTILQKEDKKHLKWVNEIKTGQKILMKDREITLGEEIGLKRISSHKLKVFNIENEPENVAIICSNRLHLPLKDLKMREQKGNDLKPLQVLEFSKDDKVAVMEKCRPINHLKWKSKDEVLSPDDTQILRPILDILIKFITENQTPVGFSINYFMLNHCNELKSLKIETKGDFDFTALENFIYHCSSENSTIFKYLMTESGMANHFIANFYDDLLQTHMKKEKIAVEDLAAIHLITDPKVVDNAKAFIEKMTELTSTICDKLYEFYPLKDYKLLEDKVNASILSLHQEHHCSGLVWPTMIQDVLNQIYKSGFKG